MSGHTPGPREVYNTTSGYVVGTPDGELAVFQNRGDALLDAAAPDLLEALRFAASMLERYELNDTKPYEAVRAAIGKAQGKS